VNSIGSTPILRRTHSIASSCPVEIAVRGMSPSLCLLGIVRMPGGMLGSFTALAPHELPTETVN
jgi:hypothetical protein